jgi:FKBP-type peptidyl-prolyl cis-trans isomerase 2/predicted heme/steroid binding protein
VKPTDSVLVRCSGKTSDGDNADFFDEDHVSFTVGDNEVMQALEHAVLAMKLGETKSFTIDTQSESHPCPTRDEELVVSLDAATLPADGRTLGTTLLMNTQSGRRPATLVELTDEQATLDMNDPIAGKTLHMEVTVLQFDVDVQLSAIEFPEPAVESSRTFSPDELRQFDGTADPQTFVSIRGYVYDVTGSAMYAPGGSYNAFAGHDATLCLAKYITSRK